MEGTEYKTKEAVLRRGQEIVGIPLKDVDKTGRLKTGKGAVGTVIEESWFGYKPNGESEPDFPEAGVELKATPYVYTSKGEKRAKERLVCNIINYMTEYKNTFYSSSFYHKCNTMLLMSYEHIYGVDKGEYTIDKAVLFSFPTADLVIIEQDWKIIIQKIRDGKAHEISEGDTLYLAACTKGANASSVRQQPFSDIMAKQRAYSLKQSYMTALLNNYIFSDVASESVIKDWHALQAKDFKGIVTDKLKQYYGKTVTELKALLNVESTAKSLNELLLSKMLGIEGRVNNTAEFKKANIVTKTIRVKENGKIKENMSFPTFDFIKISQEREWEQSELYNYLAPAVFMFVIFKEREADGELVFERIKFWNMPVSDLDEMRIVWERTVKALNDGVILERTPRGVTNNFPKQTQSRVGHVRPHAKDSSDTLPLPQGGEMPKQCFWLNHSYIEEVIKDD